MDLMVITNEALDLGIWYLAQEIYDERAYS
jgi:hypothetical protein